MNTEAFHKAITESRNGTDRFHFNPLYRNFLYSDGVKEVAESGCYWLLDILGTEVPRHVRQVGDMLIVTVKTSDSTCQIEGRLTDEGPPAYSKHISYTSLPDGEFILYVSNDGDGKLRCILPTEY